ncbi:MAG: diaminopimelate decarboxylase [Candidatus Dactylopiibacterium carminicum]|uniref:Diaminopimelate decarboxylase n=1 Tax=Candidatus Dactylopiibacterium carminicum TaxID=857335 RepID=A0A272EUH3_9RHOO|nr:diaminopimelate decarboxylase [Candidatus Dactylopiibacterium carminicum]KAF7599800.1 diaminopimelate decarboxylase [Candidatus Dactylopiibacterium carminicum]PAS93743.1 MAG: diaminopimelate decarboxylase [Candidatus Dactylopiibacterium carminicum]PAS98256.1 MAG: diaminopimelate decarboxylase [Candidatus Dactylopiibacterium carminicum]PAS99801.1 MAG: diaminopimelate decarboxylase [Candidatus Dactylopiibacterium carminicum]
MQKPLEHARLQSLAAEFGTPLWLYDAAVIRSRIAALRAFDHIRFAQKACSNTHILRLMREEGVVVDAVSPGEIQRALAAGFSSKAGRSEIVFTADLATEETLTLLVEHEIPMNAGSIDMLRQLGARAPGHRVWLRINPGFGHGHSNKTNTGGEHSKHGIWHTDLPAALAVIAQYGLRLVGLHMHIGSGVDYGHLQQVCGAMVDLVKASGQDLEAISAGGGLSIPYREGDAQIDTAHYFGLWDAARKEIEASLGHAVTLEIEPGRYLVAESGLLLTEVRATKDAGRNHFVLVDAGFTELVRPSMYGSYHAISVIPRAGQSAGPLRETVVAGPLCESGDVFTQGEGGVVETRSLPAAQVGDLLVLHDAGAYGASMSSNYNSRPLIAEVLLDGKEGKNARLIRRRQTMDELLALER